MDVLWTLPELVAEVATRIGALPAPRNGQVRAVPDDRTVRYYATIGLLDRPAAMRGRTALYGTKHVAQVVAIKRLQTMGRSLSEIQALWPTLDDPTLSRMSGVAIAAPITTPTTHAAPETSPGRGEFWKREPVATAPVAAELTHSPRSSPMPPSVPPPDVPAPFAPPHGPIITPVQPPPSPLAPPMPSPIAPSSARGTPVIGTIVLETGSATGYPPAAPGTGVELRIELAPNVVLSLSVTDESVAISPADVRAIRAAAAPLVAELASRRLTPHSGGDEP